MKTRLLLLLFLFINLILPQAVQAQTTSISLWPPLLEAMIKPGKSITQVYRLKNEGDDTVAKISLVPFSPADELGHIRLEWSIQPPAFFSLLNADLPKLPLTLNLKAGQTQELVLKIAIPETAAEADYPVALVVETDSTGLIGGTGSTTKATVAVPILLTVSKTGQPNRIAKIEQFQLLSPLKINLLDSFDQIKFILRIKNQSLTRLQTIGKITIANIFGKNVATLTLRPDHILAGSIREMKTENNKTNNLVWDPLLALGRYTATAEITPQDTANTVSQTLIFWVFPYKLAFILVLGRYLKNLLTKRLKRLKLKL